MNFIFDCEFNFRKKSPMWSFINQMKIFYYSDGLQFLDSISRETILILIFRGPNKVSQMITSFFGRLKISVCTIFYGSTDPISWCYHSPSLSW